MKNEDKFTKIASAWSTNVFDWTRRCRIATFDGYQPPLYPDRNYDAVSMVKIAREVEADVIRVSAMGKLAHFNTDQWETDEYIRNHDFLQEVIDFAAAYSALCHTIRNDWNLVTNEEATDVMRGGSARVKR